MPLPKWKRKLTKQQLKHIKETTQRKTLKEVIANIKYQDKMEFPCWECTAIARRLDIPYTLTAFNNRKD